MLDKKEYIERGAFLDMIAGNTLDTWGKGIDRSWWSHSVMVKDNFVRLLKDAPAADVVEVVHGEWVIKTDDYDNEYMMCSCCEDEFYPADEDTVDSTPDYCPTCGAKMDGERKDKP